MFPVRFICRAIIILMAVSISGAAIDARPRSFTFRALPVAPVKVIKNENVYRHDSEVPPEDAGRIAAWRREANRDIPLLRPDIYAVPGRPGYFVVSENGPVHGRDRGRRLVLIKRTAYGYTQLARSRSAGDSYILRPTFYRGGGRTVILADMGAEYAWGIMVVEIAGNRLRDFGVVNVAVPGDDAPEDARPHARLSVYRGYMRLSFATDVIFDPGGMGQRLVRRPRRGRTVFQHDGRKFLLWR